MKPNFVTQMLTKVRIKEYHIATQLSKQLSTREKGHSSIYWYDGNTNGTRYCIIILFCFLIRAFVVSCSLLYSYLPSTHFIAITDTTICYTKLYVKNNAKIM